jgi:hypothetical protein
VAQPVADFQPHAQHALVCNIDETGWCQAGQAPRRWLWTVAPGHLFGCPAEAARWHATCWGKLLGVAGTATAPIPGWRVVNSAEPCCATRDPRTRWDPISSGGT